MMPKWSPKNPKWTPNGNQNLPRMVPKFAKKIPLRSLHENRLGYLTDPFGSPGTRDGTGCDTTTARRLHDRFLCYL